MLRDIPCVSLNAVLCVGNLGSDFHSAVRPPWMFGGRLNHHLLPKLSMHLCWEANVIFDGPLGMIGR